MRCRTTHSEQRSTWRPWRRKYKVASQGNSPIRLLNIRTTSSAPEVTYNKTAWHVPSRHSNAAPTPALAKMRHQCFAHIIMLWKYHGHKGRGTTTARPECGSTALGAPDFAVSFFIYFQGPTIRKACPAMHSPNTRCNSQGTNKLRRMSRWSL